MNCYSSGNWLHRVPKSWNFVEAGFYFLGLFVLSMLYITPLSNRIKCYALRLSSAR